MFVRSFIESVVCTIKDVCHMPVTFNWWYGTLSSHMKFYTQLYHEQQFNERIWALPTNKTSASSNIVIVNHAYTLPNTSISNSFFSCTENIFFVHFLCNAKCYLIEIYTYGYLCCCIWIRTSTTTEEKRSIFSFHLCNHFTIEETKQCRHT